jgi:archaellum biogenesis ATPase FlaH
MEKQILQALLKDKSTYELFERIGDKDDFSPIARSILGAIGEYYELDPSVRGASLELIEARMLGRIQNPKHEAPLREYLRSLNGDSSGSNVEAHIRELHRRAIGGKLSLALANGAGQEEIQKLGAEYFRGDESASGTVDRNRLVDISDTSDLTDEGKGNVDYIKLWPKQLNDKLDGGALRGHHILVFARPESGKTLFAINLCAGFLHQKLKVLYVANEEPLADIRDRVRARLLKTSKSSVRRDARGSAERLAKAEIGTLNIAADTTTFAATKHLLASFRADVVVFDQIRNMRLKSDSRTAELEAAGIEARSIAKDNNALVVSITQAGDSATNKVYLEMSDVDSSKTGIPASADLMIGVGSDAAMKLNGLLGISLPKNKLSGLHDNFTVSANFQTGVID